jgi:hypothetical protein
MGNKMSQDEIFYFIATDFYDLYSKSSPKDFKEGIPRPPALFVLHTSIELALKAFLINKGLTINLLRSKKYGHNLFSLICEARRRDNFFKEPGIIQFINKLNDWGYPDSGVRYPDDRSQSRIIGGNFNDISKKIIEYIGSVVVNVNQINFCHWQ